VWAPRGNHVITVLNGDVDAMERACARLITHVETDAGVGRSGGGRALGSNRKHDRR
jgi:hypothetical protein